jgi:hypothetical protein
MLAGGCVGALEAIFTLAGKDVGEYDAIFWGVFSYSCLGLGAGFLVGLLLLVLPRGGASEALTWSIGFTVVVLFLTGWLLEGPYTSSSIFCMASAAFPATVWLIGILLRRTPLKVLPSFKGSVAMISVALLVSGVFSLTPGRPLHLLATKPQDPAGSAPNILLVVADGLRGDQLGKGGSPVLDRFFAESMIFEQAYSNSPTVDAAMASLMVGQAVAPPISDEAVSLSELLEANGYQTAAIMNDLSLGRFSNLQQGFDHYQFLPPRSPIPLTEGARRLKLIRLLLTHWSDRKAESGRRYRSSSEVLFHLRQFIQKQAPSPWFAIAHLRETQEPLYHGDRAIWPHQVPPLIAQKAYREELKRLDQALGAFWGWFEQSGYTSNTIVMLVGSSGTELQPRDRGGPSPYRQRLSVPLAIRRPSSSPGRIHHPVQLLDVPTTLARRAGLEPDPSWNGEDILDLKMKGAPPPARPIYAHFSDENRGWSMVQLEEWKYIQRHGSTDSEELYNLREDPGELNNLSEAEDERRQQMQNVLYKVESR